MKVEIWADVVCPWCAIGSHRLALALDRFPHRDEVEVVRRSIRLDKHAPTDTTVPYREAMRQRYQVDDRQVANIVNRVEALAAADGLHPFVVADNRTGNTGLAHELLAYATSQGLGETAWQRLFAAYFGEVRSVFDIDSLVALAVEIGLDADETRSTLQSHRYAGQLAADEGAARFFGAIGVPFIVVERRCALDGAQTADAILDALQSVWDAMQAEADEEESPSGVHP